MIKTFFCLFICLGSVSFCTHAWRTNFHGKEVTGKILHAVVSTLTAPIFMDIDSVAFNAWQADFSETARHCAWFAHSVTKYQRELNRFGAVPCMGIPTPVCVCSKKGAEEGAAYFLDKARTAYKNKKYKEAEEYLGYAIHFIEDALCPAHVFPFKQGVPDVHGDFEDWAEQQSTRWVTIMMRAAPVPIFSIIKRRGRLGGATSS